MLHRLTNWLETRWVTPAYAGWLLGGLTLFFLFAAANTLAGWLYVISGLSLALLVVAAFLPARSLRGIEVSRLPIQPVSAGDQLTLAIEFNNLTTQAKSLLQVEDTVPQSLGRPTQAVIEEIPAQGSHAWTYLLDTSRRGVYAWEKVHLRTATPLGLFWCRRRRAVPATAIVYPTVLDLASCPLLEQTGHELDTSYHQTQRTYNATEGSTRSLRPYRWGDPIRLIHWRTSARYGEFRVRELEVSTSGQSIVICLDSALTSWHPDHFEQAVIAAASLYFYASRNNTRVQLWTAATGTLQGERTVLEALARVNFAEKPPKKLPNQPLIWLSQNPASLSLLPPGSRWLLWTDESSQVDSGSGLMTQKLPGFYIQPDEPLQPQLQAAVS